MRPKTSYDSGNARSRAAPAQVVAVLRMVDEETHHDCADEHGVAQSLAAGTATAGIVAFVTAPARVATPVAAVAAVVAAVVVERLNRTT